MNLFGLYVPGTSLMHRLGPGVKYLLLLALTIPVVVISQPIPSLVALLLSAALLASCGLRPRLAWHLGWGFVIVAALLAAYQLFAGRVDLAIAVTANLTTAVFASRLLIMTTPGPVLIDGLVRACRPLRMVKIDPEYIGLAVAIMLRSVPVLVDGFAEVRKAARARGREHSLFALVTPVVVRAVGHAQSTGAALAARGLLET